MYNSVRTIDISGIKDTAIALTAKSGMGLASWRILKADSAHLELAYDLQPLSDKSSTKHTHDSNADSRRAYYLLDMKKGIAPHIHRAVTCNKPVEYPTKFSKKVLAFTGGDEVKVTDFPDGMTSLDFIPMDSCDGGSADIFAIDMHGVDAGKVRKVQLLTLR